MLPETFRRRRLDSKVTEIERIRFHQVFSPRALSCVCVFFFRLIDFSSVSSVQICDDGGAEYLYQHYINCCCARVYYCCTSSAVEFCCSHVLLEHTSNRDFLPCVHRQTTSFTEPDRLFLLLFFSSLAVCRATFYNRVSASACPAESCAVRAAVTPCYVYMARDGNRGLSAMQVLYR